MASSASADFSVDLEIMRVANVLLMDPPSSAEEMLKLLDTADDILSSMEKTLPDSQKNVLLPIMKTLITDNILKSRNEEISASAASCFAELMRIAAPDAPYEDDIMEEVFRLMAETFTKLSQPSGRCYEKATTTLYTVARVKACLLMLDLELYELMVEVFNNFLSVIEVNNTEGISWSIEAIITDVLEEGEWVHPTLLKPLLSCLKKGEKRVTPISAAMVDRIIRNCAATIQPLLKEAVQLEGSSVDNYASVVASICCGKLTCLGPAHSNGTSGTEEDVVFVKYPDSQKSVQAGAEAGAFIDDKRMGHTGTSTGSTKFDMEICALPKTRSQKPNSLILPEEGYDHPGAGLHEDTPKPKHRRRTMARAASVTLAADNPSSFHTYHGTGNLKMKLQKSSRKRRKLQLMDLPTTTGSTPAEPDIYTTVPNDVQHPSNELVGRRIKVWWPKDKMFYDGIVHSFDPIKKKHRVLYTDGEEELLNLRRQQWELIQDQLSHEEVKADVLKDDPSRDRPERTAVFPHVDTLPSPPRTNAAVSDDSSEDTVSDDNIYEIRLRPWDKHRQTDAVSNSESSETTLDNGVLPPRPRSRVNGRR